MLHPGDTVEDLNNPLGGFNAREWPGDTTVVAHVVRRPPSFRQFSNGISPGVEVKESSWEAHASGAG